MMFNILSGLQAGSHSVAVVSRANNSGQTFTKGMVAKSVGGKLTAATNADFRIAEYVFEDVTTQSSGKYTVVFGSFEAETDQIDDSTNGAIAVDDYLAPYAGKLAKCAAGDLTSGYICARVTGITAATVDNATGAAIGKVVRFRTV
jgi:hypothetical protein